MEIAALILAGGHSRRMGQDKALLALPTRHGSKPLLAHISDVATSCTPHTYILTPWPERYAQHLTTATFLAEKSEGAGPLVALNQGWKMILIDYQQRGEASPDWLLVLACDLPDLNPKVLRSWSHTLGHIQAPAIAALPRHLSRWEPLCGFYHRRCLPALTKAIQQNERSFQKWLANETVVPLQVTDPKMLRNCNTPAQWQIFVDNQTSRNP